MRDSGLLDAINAVLVAGMRVAERRAVEQTAGIIDNLHSLASDAAHRRKLGLFRQWAKTTEAGGPRGYDAGKKTKGRNRHIAIDTAGNLLDALVRPADIQDCHGAPELIERYRDAYPSLARFFADGGYAGQKLKTVIVHLDRLAIETVRRIDGWSSEPSLGSIVADASPRIGRQPSRPPSIARHPFHLANDPTHRKFGIMS